MRGKRRRGVGGGDSIFGVGGVAWFKNKILQCEV
jgi:hypothetical protein